MEDHHEQNLPPQTDATTFAFASVFILLLCVTVSTPMRYPKSYHKNEPLFSWHKKCLHFQTKITFIYCKFTVR